MTLREKLQYATAAISSEEYVRLLLALDTLEAVEWARRERVHIEITAEWARVTHWDAMRRGPDFDQYAPTLTAAVTALRSALGEKSALNPEGRSS